MPSRRHCRPGASVALVACLGLSLHAGAAPRPVYAPSGSSFADPSVVNHNDQFYAMATAAGTHVASGATSRQLLRSDRIDDLSDGGGRRAMYLGVLGWDSRDNPVIHKFLSPE